MRTLLAVLLLLVPLAATPAQTPPPQPAPDQSLPDTLLTVAERSKFKATARYDEVVGLIDRLVAASPLVRKLDLGVSTEGRSIPVMVIADPPVETPEEAAAQVAKGKLVVLLIGNIHAGEVDGKEALPILAREIVTTPSHPLLKDLILAIVPIYNPDGNEQVAKDNRPGQLGPEEGMGQRANAQGLDLNRDFVKLEAPETRGLVRFITRWDPALVIDTHTTNGSYHRYLITYGGPRAPAGDPRTVEFVRDTMLPEVGRMFKAATGFESFPYGDFNADHTRWEGYPAHARYGTNYVGLRNRLSVLSEAYSYAPYKDRVLGTRDFVRASLEYVAAHKDTIKTLLASMDSDATAKGKTPATDDLVAIRSRAEARPATMAALGFVEEERDGKTVSTGEPKDYQVDVIDRFVPVLSVQRPFAYLLRSAASKSTPLIETLQRHGIQVEELREDIDLDIELFRVAESTASERPFQGHHLRTLKGSWRPETRRIEAGTLLVRTAQPLSSLAVYLLEPESEDGLTTWGLLDPLLSANQDYPIVRVPGHVPVISAKIRPLPEDRKIDQPLTFEALHESDSPPNFAGSPVGGGGLQWLDDGEHFLQVKDRRLWKVEAATGRAEPFHDIGAMAAGLAALPTIAEKAARSIAERTSFRMTPDRSAALVEHEGDLYYARFDGARAARLTSSPEVEELASFSPGSGGGEGVEGGRYVAFVRRNDLWVVDTATATERALTTGGHDLLRNGKADWVYFEEVFNRDWRTYWWSPDGSHLAFLQIDSGQVPTYTLVDDLPEPHGVERAPYPKPGDPNPRVKLGVVSAAGGPVRWADLSAYSAESFLITGVGWRPDSAAVWFYGQDRTQTWLDFCSLPAAGSTPTRLFREKTEAWVESPGDPDFLADGSFLWPSERTGWKHLYRFGKDGELAATLTAGEWEARSIKHVDEGTDEASGGEGAGDGWVYFTGTKDSPIAENLYRVRLDGSAVERLTSDSGSHRVEVSPTGSYFIDTWSNRTTPTRVALRAADGTPVRTLDTNPVYACEEYRFGPDEQFQITLADGFQMEASLVKPPAPDFDATRKYPVWFTTYAGPHAPTISDSWGGGRTWDQMLAQSGIIVFRADPRSASGKGARSAWTAYRQLGVQELKDIEEAIAWLIAQPYVDASRIGISGHSYGGYMTAYAMTHSTRFAAGIAGAPVTDWRDYDSIYTERFMGTPQDNPDGYDAGSALKAAKDLHGRLLLLHGTADDNVHPQNTLRFAKALQEANKPFEMMFYPGSRHGLHGKHYQRLMYDFIQRTIGGGPKDPDADGTPEPPPADSSPAEPALGP